MSDRSVQSHRHGKPKGASKHPHGLARGDYVQGPGPLGGDVEYECVDAKRGSLLLRDTDGYCFVIGARRLSANGLWRRG